MEREQLLRRLEEMGQMERKTEGRQSKGFVKLNGCQLENRQDHLNHQGKSEGSESEKL